MRKAIFGILALAIVLMMVGASADEADLDLSILGKSKQSCREGETVTYEFKLENTADVTQSVEVTTYTPRYYGDPGFFHNVYIGDVAMGHYFVLEMEPDEIVYLDLDVWAYDSPDEVPMYQVDLHAFSTLDADWIRTETRRAGGGGGGPGI